MPPEPLPWDRKDFFKERKHERSESLGSVARWRDSSHHGSREFSRWGSADFRRPPGHGKQGGWHLFSEESGHGYALSRSSDKMLEEDNCRPSVSRGDGKYGRNSRENRGSFSQRDWRGHSWETTNGSLNMSRRPLDVTNEQRSADDMLTYPSHPHSDFVNTWDQHHLKEQHDKMGGVNGMGTGQKSDREQSLGSIDWKHLKWTRSGSLSSRGSGFSHTSSSRSIGGADSNEAKSELQPKNAAPIESHSGDGAACVTSSAPSEETMSRKKPRLNWGEGLAKYEKKKVEPDVSQSKDGPVFSTSNIEPCNFLGSNLLDKSPKVTGFSDCASPATPSSVACSSSPGADDKLYGKSTNIDNDVSTLSGSMDPGPQNHLQMFPFNLEKLDIDSLSNLGSSLTELLQSDDPSSVDPGTASSAAMNKLLIWKADVSKVLEVTEAEIDLLENELKLLKSESGNSYSCPAALGSLQVGNGSKSCEEHVGGSGKVSRPEPLQICSSDHDVQKMSPSTNVLSVHENGKEEDVDSPGTATSKFVEPQPLITAVSSCDMRRHDNCSGDLDGIQSASMRCLVPCSASEQASVSAWGGDSASMVAKDGLSAAPGANVCSRAEDILCNTIISSNKESANRVIEEFASLLPKDCSNIGNVGNTSDVLSCNAASVKEKFSEKKRSARIKERVITLKFKALHHQWKEDTRSLSVRKCRPKSHKKLDLGTRTTNSAYQKNRSSGRSRISCTGNNLSLVPTPEIIKFASKLLSEPQVKVLRSTLKMPALILDEKEKKISRFPSTNGLVEDPLVYEKERAMINPWTPDEKNVFMEKFAAFGKDFRKIASFLDHKTTADCVEFYYKNHKSDCFDKIKQDARKLGKSFLTNSDLVASGKKWNREVNAASLEILSAASAMAGQADSINGNKKIRSASFLLGGYGKMKTSKVEDSIPERSNSFDALGDEREAVAADVLAGICGSLSSEAMSSCITSSVDPIEGNKDGKFLKANVARKQLLTPDATQNVDDETCSDDSFEEMDPSDWTDEEKSAFLQAVSSFGKDFAKISRCVGSRSEDQCKVFFSKGRKCLGLDLMRPKSVSAGHPVNDDVNGGGSDADDPCIVETGSATGTDRSGIKPDENQPLSVVNANSDEFSSLEVANLSGDLKKSNNIIGTEADHQDVEAVDMVSDACEMKGKSKLGSSGGGDVSYGSDKSGSTSGQTVMNMSGSIEVGKDDKDNKPEVTDSDMLQSTCGEVKLVSEISSGDNGMELGQKPSLPLCLDDKDNKHEAVADCGVDLKSSVQGSSTMVNVLPSSEGDSCTGLDLEAEIQRQISLQNSCVSALPLENSQSTANLLLQDAIAVPGQKTASQYHLPSTFDFQGSNDMRCHNSVSNDSKQIHFPKLLLDHVESTSILQGFPLPIKNEVNGGMTFSSFTDYHKTQSRHSDSEVTSRNGDVKLFGKILSNPSSSQKSNVSSKGREENGTRHPKLSSKSSSLNFNGHHQNTDGNSTILKFDRSDYSRGLENVPVRSFGYWDGSKIQTGMPSLPDSAILLAKYPAAFSNYPTSSAKLEQQSLQTFTKSNEQHLNGSSSFAPREMNNGNGVIDYQMYRSRDVPKVQPFMVDVKHRQDVFSEVQRRNGFDAMSNIQQQGRGMVGLNGVGRPGILMGGSHSGVSDLMAAIKMHYSNSEQYGGQNGSIKREDESWGGKKGDLSSR